MKYPFPWAGDVIFRGEFPFAELSFQGSKLPGNVQMKAYNPFIYR